MAEALNALVGIDFSLIGTQLHAAYEKMGDGYKILLIPSKQVPDEGISVLDLIEDIKKLMKGISGNEKEEVDTTGLSNNMEGLAPGVPLKDLKIKLQMAYLYMNKPGMASKEAPVLEYAFQLQLLATDLIPKELTNLVTVSNLSVSVWNTTRNKVLEQMALVSIDEYIGKQTPAVEKEEDKNNQNPPA